MEVRYDEDFSTVQEDCTGEEWYKYRNDVNVVMCLLNTLTPMSNENKC